MVAAALSTTAAAEDTTSVDSRSNNGRGSTVPLNKAAFPEARVRGHLKVGQKQSHPCFRSLDPRTYH